MDQAQDLSPVWQPGTGSKEERGLLCSVHGLFIAAGPGPGSRPAPPGLGRGGPDDLPTLWPASKPELSSETSTQPYPPELAWRLHPGCGALRGGVGNRPGARVALYAALAFRVTGRGLWAELIHELEEAAKLRLALAQGRVGRGRRWGPEHLLQRAPHQLPVPCSEFFQQALGLQVLLLVHQPPLCAPAQNSTCRERGQEGRGSLAQGGGAGSRASPTPPNWDGVRREFRVIRKPVVSPPDSIPSLSSSM